MPSIIIVLMVLVFPGTEVTGLIGYDCGGRHLNVTTMSLLDVGECDTGQRKANTSTLYIQLLQLSEYSHTEVMQCKVEISRTIYHCGMHSHISAVHNGRADYLHETGYDQCNRIARDGVLSLGMNNVLEGIKINQTTTRSITLAGKINNDGTCQGIQYSDPYGTWDDVIVLGVARITIKTSFVPVQLDIGKIILKSGTVCPLKDGYCIDSEDGYSFWKPLPQLGCDFHQYDVLYEGMATKFLEISEDQHPSTIYSLVTQETTFALTKTKGQSLCGYTLFGTEHPKLFILETTKGDSPLKKSPIHMENLDIFLYMNSKFVYVEKHIRQQMTSLYRNIIQQKCELERQVLTNALSYATLQPDEFAFRLMKGPGYMAVVAGEAIFVLKCIPVDVLIRRTEECYLELPVTLVNSSWFLKPKSRMLTKFGNKVDCDPELPTLYRIEDNWVQFTPRPQNRLLPPHQLQPMTAPTWKYLSPGPLAVSGIYAEEDIRRLREHIMFPAEKPALLNNIARGLSGRSMSADGVSLYNLLDEDSLNRIAETAASRIWSGFITFGSATAGLLGIFIIIRMIKLILDTAIHGYALHSVYGCSLHLLGAIWDSVTHLLLHLAKPKPQPNKDITITELRDVQPTCPATKDQDMTTQRPTVETGYQCVVQTAPIRIQPGGNLPPNDPSSSNINNTSDYTALSQRLYNLEQIPLPRV